MGLLAVLLIILALVGIVATILVAADAITTEKKDSRASLWGLASFFAIITAVVIVGAVLLGSAHYTNHFYKLNAEYEASKANVVVMEEKAVVLEGQLNVLLESYIRHEESLINTVKGRNLEELRMLFERYPQLQASGNVQQVTDEFIALTEDIAHARLVVNAVARAYNTSQHVFPSSHFAPGNLPTSLPLFEAEVETEG